MKTTIHGILLVILTSLVLACGSSNSKGAAGNSQSNPGTGGSTAGAPSASGGVVGGDRGGSGVGAAGAPSPGDTAGAAGAAADSVIVQEDAPGFGAIDGKVLPRQGSTSITGYTGTGFADSDPGLGKTISWSVKVDAAGTYSLVWRYAFGGAAENLRDAQLSINGVVAASSVSFPYTGTWTDWQETTRIDVELTAGYNFLLLQALYASGLANIDYLKLYGSGIHPETPSYQLSVNADDVAGGSVSYAPVLAFYPQGTVVTLTATANPGYFFQSWTGDVPAAVSTHMFAVSKNTTEIARFLPLGATQDPSLVGYAAVQDDNGTPYLVTGGSLGNTVAATSLDELKSYLGSPEPYIVTFSGLYQGVDKINIASNKTLLGVGATAHLMGIGLAVNGSRNVIIRNVAVSHIVADGTGIVNDAIEITGGAKNIWIDHCDLYSDLLSGKDYYDGLLDIKNASAFITVSWTTIHDHWKASLISSGDEQLGDSVIRVTYHHNYFYACGSRLPSIRFGKAHIFNNYYQNNAIGSCINSRMGAIVRVENNYFESSDNPIGFWDSPLTGYWDVTNNVFSLCTGSQPTVSTGQLTPGYVYTLDAPDELPSSVVAGAGVGKM